MAITTTSKTYSLDEYMSEREKELARAREVAKREADVGVMKLQKYLQPSARTAAQGYSQGLSETAMIAAENSRQRAHAAADAAYTAGYNDLMAQYRAEKKAEQDGLYADVMGVIDAGEWHTTADLATYLYGEDGKSGATAGLSDEQRSVIKQKYDTIAGNPDQQAEDAAYGKKVLGSTMSDLGFKKADGVRLKRGLSGEDGDNFVIEGGDGTKYRVEIDEEIDIDTLDNEFTTDFRKYIADGEVFSFQGNVFIRSGDKFYRVQGRGNRSTAGINDLKALFY